MNLTPSTVPGNSAYSGTIKHGSRICVAGDNHIKNIRRNDFNKELLCGSAFCCSFSGTIVNRLRHNFIPTLMDDKLDAIVIHVGTNNISNHDNHENIARSVINIGLDCKNNGFNEMLIWSIFEILLPLCVDSMTCSEFYVRKMVLVSFVMVLLQMIIYGKMLFICRAWQHIF